MSRLLKNALRSTKLKKMKKKSSTRSTLAHPAARETFQSSVSVRHFPTITARRRACHAVAPRMRGEGGFFNLRALLGLTLCFFGLALAILAGRDGALRRAPQPERYMPVPGDSPQSEATRLEQ